MFTLALFLIGHLSQSLFVTGGWAKSVGARAAASFLFYLLPNLEIFNWKNGVVYGEVRSPAILSCRGYFATGGVFSWRVFSSRGKISSDPSAPSILAPARLALPSPRLHLTPIFRDAARRFGIVDAPDGKLKTQKDSIPYFGGVAVFAAVLFPVSLFLEFSDKVSGLLLACSIIVLLGLIDDIGRLSPRVKLLVQVTAVFLMMKSGPIRIETSPSVASPLWMSDDERLQPARRDGRPGRGGGDRVRPCVGRRVRSPGESDGSHPLPLVGGRPPRVSLVFRLVQRIGARPARSPQRR
jgi:hypothetical protein